MEGPRPPFENELANVVRFLDSQLRPKEGWSIASEYPVAFSEANRAFIRIITESDKVVSHALIRPMIVKAPVGLIKVAALGSVVTSSEHRNQGLSTKTIDSCLEAARGSACEMAILWTNLYDFYRRMGFELAGTEVAILLDREIQPPEAPGLKIMEGAKVAADAIHRLYSQHSVTSIRSVEETRKYLQIPNSRVYTAWDAQGQLKAYAVEGKGADLGGYVHEWGGGVSALLPLFAHIRRTQKRPITIIVPGHSQNLLRAFEPFGVKHNEGLLGMIKILDHQSLFGKIQRLARAKGVSDLVMEARPDGKFYIGTGDKIFTTENETDIVKLIFGPLKASEIPALGETAQLLENVLPLDMWIWGWDSV
jgi:GNAT superfamily N-acetyltransferase